MPHWEEDEQPSHDESDAEGSDQEEQESDENSDSNDGEESAEKPADAEAQEVDDNFDEEEEVLSPKPFPHTIQIVLPRKTASPSLSTDAFEKEPTCVHVCLTRGTINASTPPLSTNADPAATESTNANEDMLDEYGVPTTAARIQGCCADAHCFETDYSARLDALRRRHILRRLNGNRERQRRFLELERKKAQQQAERVEEDGDVSGEERAADEDADPVGDVLWPWTSTQQPPPYWLPSLLSNDAQTFYRVLQVMYGWVIAPEPHPSDKLQLNAAGQLLFGTSNGAETNGVEDEDDDVDQTDPAHHNSDFFLLSNAFVEGGENEEQEEEDGAKEDSELLDEDGNTHGSHRTSKILLNDLNECDSDGNGELPPLPSPLSQRPDPSAAGATSLGAFSSQTRSMDPPQAKLSSATAPPPVVALPSFPFTGYEFFIAQDTTSGEWHLLDTHPLFVMEACRRHRAEQQEQAEEQPHPQDEDEEDDDNDDNDGESGSNADSAASKEDSDDKSVLEFPVPTYDIQTMIPVSPIILSALFSAPALRCSLLQPLKSSSGGVAEAQEDSERGDADESELGKGVGASQRVSDRDVLRTLDHVWLSADVSVALPILATICRARQHVLQQDTTRIPYPLGSIWLDVWPLFALTGFHDTSYRISPEDVRQWCIGPGEDALGEDESEYLENEVGEDDAQGTAGLSTQPSQPAAAMAASTVQWHKWGAALDHILSPECYGRMILSALLAADILPTRAVGLGLFNQLDGLRLALWWWLHLPQSIIRRWGIDEGAADGAEAGLDDTDEGEEGLNAEDEEDEEIDALLSGTRTEEATELLAQRVATLQQREAQQRRRQQRQQGPLLLFAPLLQRVLLELQRRLDRCHTKDSEGNALPPSQFSLQESVARTYAVERLDSGRPRQDPLVTTAFVSAAVPAGRGFGSGDAGDSDEQRGESATTKAASNPTTSTATVRHHRLYQSDLVLLALALTTTPAPWSAQRGDIAKSFANGDCEDAHTALFRHLFEAKLLRCVRSPVDRARAGMTKLLLLCAADFCLSATRKCVFMHLPAYELFGNTGYCPLPELVQAWAGAATRSGSSVDVANQQMKSTVTDFAFYLWNEVRWRLWKGQYEAAAVVHMQQQLPELFALVESHTKTYYATLARLQSEADAKAAAGAGNTSTEKVDASTSAKPHALQCKPSPPIIAAKSTAAASRRAPACSSGTPKTRTDACNPTMTAASIVSLSYPAAISRMASPPPSPPLTIAHPNVYSATVLKEKAHVYDLWRAFPVDPATYLTPETLHILLFGQRAEEDGEGGEVDCLESSTEDQRHFSTAALRVLFENGINTVQRCPLDTAEMPAMEAALRRADVDAVKVLLGLGAASLHDLRVDGSATLESWAEAIFSPADMEVLHFVEAKNGMVVRCDPRVQYGARRFESTAMPVQ
ncbi:hypothetical protein ABL78_5703 [Leptomonas seymouri]|uniref:Uncharacterized protein n=1 Tax=Leptomonas seymouri TaxID=5684 RepID=A0A0N1I1W7_LEPSE|nr:hypothetical protein ABL78_5703 [Leptomonas seymouri]|eukprot:KPI85250.1 hypothetical protein ABL78_5703 [Leptomonas seymouri]